jgi:hypothetical protein
MYWLTPAIKILPMITLLNTNRLIDEVAVIISDLSEYLAELISKVYLHHL